MSKTAQKLDKVTIRFAGDSGDGIQLTGGQFTNTTAMFGNDLSTLPDFPAEIRAPAGTTFGVSGFQIQFSSLDIHTPGDQFDVLIAMNPAALKVNLSGLKLNGIIIANKDAFQERNLKLAGYSNNPLEDKSLEGYQVIDVAISTLTREALVDSPLSPKEKDRCKNFFALGIAYWMFTRPLKNSEEWIRDKFKAKPDLVEANLATLNAGYNYALSTEIFTTTYVIQKAHKKPGIYRNITGNEALVIGLVTAAHKADKQLFLGGYPITPASDILHIMSRYKNYNVVTFQAEDEIAGIGAALGAAYTGSLGVTASSGPGIALKAEFLGYAVMVELPLVILNVQRGGPSTGLPTKTEQSDLLQAMFGRNGEAPMPVIAAKSPADCFNAAYQAAKVALTFTTPVMLLSDGYLANGAEPWLIPDPEKIPAINLKYADNPDTFHPYKRDKETLARLMALPGVPELEHRIGGLEKEDISGNVSYDSENHDKMVRLRAEKVQRVKKIIEEPDFFGEKSGKVLIVSWGSTFGSIYNVYENFKKEDGLSWCHLNWINPLPDLLAGIIHNFDKIVVPEINLGQLSKIIRAEFLVETIGLNIVKGLPLGRNEIYTLIKDALKD